MPSNKDGHQAKNVDVKLDVKAHRTRKTCCITKTSNNKELVRRKSHGASKIYIYIYIYINKERQSFNFNLQLKNVKKKMMM